MTITGEINTAESVVLGFAGDCHLTQKKMIHMALKTPMTINELYRAFPCVSEQNVAPLVAQLVQENKAWVIGKRKTKVGCGVERTQNIYSTREEDKPVSKAENLAMLDRAFLMMRARVK